MKTAILFLMVLGLSLISTPSIRAFGFNDQPNVVGTINYVPLTPVSVDVTLKNNPGVDPCNTCATWYISVYEWDGSTGYRLIGSAKAFSSGPTYTWSGLSWDYSTYPCLVLRWHYVDQGGGGCGYSTPDQQIYICPGTPPPGIWLIADFFPC